MYMYADLCTIRCCTPTRTLWSQSCFQYSTKWHLLCFVFRINVSLIVVFFTRMIELCGMCLGVVSRSFFRTLQFWHRCLQHNHSNNNDTNTNLHVCRCARKLTSTPKLCTARSTVASRYETQSLIEYCISDCQHIDFEFAKPRPLPKPNHDSHARLGNYNLFQETHIGPFPAL